MQSECNDLLLSCLFQLFFKTRSLVGLTKKIQCIFPSLLKFLATQHPTK